MTYPPTLPPGSRTNATLTADTHPEDHNQLRAAVTALIEELGAAPSGAYADLTSRLLDVDLTFTKKAQLPILMTDFDGAGQGDVDADSAALMSAVGMQALTGRPIHFSGSVDWNLDTKAVITTSGAWVTGDGSDATTITLHGSTGAIQFQGSLPAKAAPTTTLSANATVTDGAASNTIQVASAANLAVGDIILIGDDYTIPGAATINASWALRERGELQRIKSIAGTTVTLEGALRDDYTTARNASVHKLAPLYGNGVRGITFRNATPEATTYNRMVQFWACAGVILDDVQFERGDYTGLSLDYVFNVELRGVGGADFADNIGLGMAGYIINFGPCENVRAFGGNFLRARHAITTDGWAGHRGWPRNIKVVGAQATGTTAAAFDTHPWGSDIEYIDCTARSSFLAFQVRTKRTKIINGGSDKCTAGDVLIYGGTATDVEIIVGVYRRSLAEGISFTGSVDLGYPARITISEPTFIDTWGRPVRMSVPVDDCLCIGVKGIRPSRVSPTGAGNGTILIDDGIAPARFKALRNISVGGNCVVTLGSLVTGARVVGNNGYELVGTGAAAVRGTGTATASNRLRDNYDLTADLTFSDPEYFVANSRARFGYDTNSVIIDDNGGAAREILLRSGGTVRLRVGTTGMIRINEAGVGSAVGPLIALPNVTTPPSTNPTGGGVLYSETGALKWRSSSGDIFNTTKQVVSGSRGGNAALASVLSALATQGLITDSTSA